MEIYNNNFNKLTKNALKNDNLIQEDCQDPRRNDLRVEQYRDSLTEEKTTVFSIIGKNKSPVVLNNCPENNLSIKIISGKAKLIVSKIGSRDVEVLELDSSAEHIIEKDSSYVYSYRNVSEEKLIIAETVNHSKEKDKELVYIPDGVSFVPSFDDNVSFRSSIYGSFWSHLLAPDTLLTTPAEIFLRKYLPDLSIESIKSIPVDSKTIYPDNFGKTFLALSELAKDNLSFLKQLNSLNFVQEEDERVKALVKLTIKEVTPNSIFEMAKYSYPEIDKEKLASFRKDAKVNFAEPVVPERLKSLVKGYSEKGDLVIVGRDESNNRLILNYKSHELKIGIIDKTDNFHYMSVIGVNKVNLLFNWLADSYKQGDVLELIKAVKVYGDDIKNIPTLYSSKGIEASLLRWETVLTDKVT